MIPAKIIQSMGPEFAKVGQEILKQGIAIGVNIGKAFQRKASYEVAKETIAPIAQKLIKDANPEIRSIGGYLLQNMRNFKP